MSDVLIKIRTILQKEGAEAASKELDTLIQKQDTSTTSSRSAAREMEANRRALAGLSAAAQASQGSFTGLANIAYTLGGRFAVLGTQITMVLGAFSAGWAIGKKIQETLVQPLIDAAQAADQAGSSVDALALAQNKIATEANIKRVEALIDATDAYTKAQDASTEALNKQADVTKDLLNLQLDMEEAKVKASTPSGPERDKALQAIATRRAQIGPTIDISLEEERIIKAQEGIAFRNQTEAAAFATERATREKEIAELKARRERMLSENEAAQIKRTNGVVEKSDFQALPHTPGEIADIDTRIAEAARIARGAEVTKQLQDLRKNHAEKNEAAQLEITDATARKQVQEARLALIPAQQQAAAADLARTQQAEAEKAAKAKAAALREERIKSLQLNLDRSRDPRERFVINKQIEKLRISQIDTPDPDIQRARSQNIQVEESSKRRSDLFRGLNIPEPAYGAGERSESSRSAPRRPSRITKPSPEPAASSLPTRTAPRGDRSESSAAVAALEAALADQNLTLKTLVDLLAKQSAAQKTTRDQLRRRFD